MRINDAKQDEFLNVPFRTRKEEIAWNNRRIIALNARKDAIYAKLVRLGIKTLGGFGPKSLSADDAIKLGYEISHFKPFVTFAILRPENRAKIMYFRDKLDAETELLGKIRLRNADLRRRRKKVSESNEFDIDRPRTNKEELEWNGRQLRAIQHHDGEIIQQLFQLGAAPIGYGPGYMTRLTAIGLGYEVISPRCYTVEFAITKPKNKAKIEHLIKKATVYNERQRQLEHRNYELLHAMDGEKP